MTSTPRPVGTRRGAAMTTGHDAGLDTLAVRAGRGDRVALDRLLGLVRTPVVKYCRARLGDVAWPRSSADVADDVLLTVCGELPGFRPGSTAATFVHGIARRTVDAALRDAPPARRSRAGRRRDLIERLPPAQREVLVLRVVLQYSVAETAYIVGSTPAAVRVTQHHALVGLRGLLAESPGLDLVDP